MLRSIDTILFGRVAYEALAQYWPTAGEAPDNRPYEAEWAKRMNSLPKIVFSRALREIHWSNSRTASENIREEVIRLKAKPGKDIALFAGVQITTALMEMGVIDEYRSIIGPHLLGSGKRLFERSPGERALKHVETGTYRPGHVMIIYR